MIIEQDLNTILKTYWGHNSFRPLQEDIIRSILKGNDTLALLPTGGGKSICFQVPAMAKDGICIVISPLIALMKDQVENLVKRNIPAVAIFSGMTKREIDIALDNCIYGKTKFLYVSPERLSTELFQVRVQKMNVNLIAVDEAHCISQWGYDFRPSYLLIAEIRTLLPEVPVLALTATATPQVRIDVREKLQFKNEKTFTQSFERKNLSYSVFYEENKLQRMRNILSKVPGTAIVYVRNRAKTQEIARLLQRNSISADFYHAGLSSSDRSRKQDEWINNKTRVIVATNAFGMGIDKADVRLVIHLDFPDSPEAYYQEAGRAGRDQKKAYAVLLYNQTDLLDVDDRIKKQFPEKDEIKKVYQALGEYFDLAYGSGAGASFDFDMGEFCRVKNMNSALVYGALNLLASEGYIGMNDSVFLPSRVLFLMRGEALYQYEVSNIKDEKLIKLLLRSTEGIFNSYTKINEALLRNQTGLSLKDLREQLMRLEKDGVLNFVPAKDQAQIIFLYPRLETKRLELNHSNLKKRKSTFEEKINTVKSYATNKSKCRSIILLEYLGEKNPKRCNECDVCIQRNKLDLNDLEFNSVKNQVKASLMNTPLSIESLMQSIKDVNEDKAMKVILWLIDNQKISYTEEHLLKYSE